MTRETNTPFRIFGERSEYFYNKKMVDEPVDSWNILWDEKYTDSILMQDSVRDAFAVALKSLDIL